jgi:hypothetical protein
VTLRRLDVATAFPKSAHLLHSGTYRTLTWVGGEVSTVSRRRGGLVEANNVTIAATTGNRHGACGLNDAQWPRPDRPSCTGVVAFTLHDAP